MIDMLKNHFKLILIVSIMIIIVAIVLSAMFEKNNVRRCYALKDLTELIKCDLMDAEIINIQYKHEEDQASGGYCTTIWVLIKENNGWETKEYYNNKLGAGIYDPRLENIYYEQIEKLSEIGIGLDQIEQHGTNFGQIRVGFSIAPYTIEWYKIDESYDGEANIILVATIPKKVTIEKKLYEQIGNT